MLELRGNGSSSPFWQNTTRRRAFSRNTSWIPVSDIDAEKATCAVPETSIDEQALRAIVRACGRPLPVGLRVRAGLMMRRTRSAWLQHMLQVEIVGEALSTLPPRSARVDSVFFCGQSRHDQ